MRGRPRKPRCNFPTGNSNYPSKEDIETLRTATLQIAQRNNLPEEKTAALTSALIDAMGHFPSIEELRKQVPVKGRGNRRNIHIQILLHDCAVAWAEATGSKPAIWEKEPIGKDKAQESVSVSLARIIYKIATGIKLTSSLDRQARNARGIRRL